MTETIQFPGAVEWSGENPGISLKEQPEGPFTTLASFFRVVLSPHGRGHALVLFQAPGFANPTQNLCLTDNEPLARYLVQGFLSHFGAFKGLPSLGAIGYRAVDRVAASGDPTSTYTETAVAGDLTVALTWSGLGEPFCFANPPPLSATGMHYMPSLFIGCRSASITVNGVARPGQPSSRKVAGRDISTAMLAFSETWIRA